MNKLILLLVFLSNICFAQKYLSGSSEVTFFSKAAIEDIAAKNSKSSSLFDSSAGDIVFVIPITDFEFQKSLMKEHFNEKYMESEKFPKATFQGKISGFSASATGVQQARAKGKLTIHGVTKEVEIPGTLELRGGTLSLKTEFMVTLSEYNIAIPTLLFKNIAERVKVTAAFTYTAQ